jgi:hypothetical protein
MTFSESVADSSLDLQAAEHPARYLKDKEEPSYEADLEPRIPFEKY